MYLFQKFLSYIPRINHNDFNKANTPQPQDQDNEQDLKEEDSKIKEWMRIKKK